MIKYFITKLILIKNIMIENIELFKISSNAKEPYVDDYYIKKNKAIITYDNEKINEIMKANLDLLDNISAYKVASDSKNIEMQNIIIKNIISLLETTGINFSEFTSYWAVKDMSYSIYNKTLKTESLKIEFLKNIIPEFIKDRHFLYKIHGYSYSTLQAVCDSKSHKANSNAGNTKITKLLEENGFSHFNLCDISKFKESDKIFIYPDKKDKELFQEILKEYKIYFNWSKNHENKQTDFLFKINNKIFIMEHKHMKEAGGGQDKQMSEIIDFISYTEDNDNIHYISFLDGIYFNVVSDESITKGKPFEQRKSIVNNLNGNKRNFFVNTNGFIWLVNNLKQRPSIN